MGKRIQSKVWLPVGFLAIAMGLDASVTRMGSSSVRPTLDHSVKARPIIS